MRSSIAALLLLVATCARANDSKVTEAKKQAPAGAMSAPGMDAREERVEKQIDLVFGEDAKDVRAYADQVSRFSEFNRKQLTFALLFLGEAGFRNNALPRALSACLDVAALSLNKELGLTEALGAVTDVKRSASVSELSLRRLGLGRPLYQRLAASRGDSKGDAEAALETLYVMIAKKTGRPLGGAAVSMSKR
jgi:hypothetical protein